MKRLCWLLLALTACGDVTSAAIDAATTDGTVGADARIDAGAPRCGDHNRTQGEVCFGAPMSLIGTDVVYDARLADLDADGDLDVVYLIGDQFVAHVNSGGAFAPAGLPGATTEGLQLLARDLNNDGRAELINQSSAAIELWRADAGGFRHTRTGVVSPPARGTPGGVVLAELDGAAPAELVGIYPGSLMIGKIGAGLTLSLGSGVAFSSGAGAALAVARFDGDTLDDIVVGGAGGIVLYRGLAGGFAPVLVTAVSTAVTAVTAGDYNRDGTADIAFVESNGMGMMRGAGGGAFLGAIRRSVDGARPAIATGDIDGDGFADVALGVSNAGVHSIAILRGLDTGSLAQPVMIPIAVAPDYLHLDGDINGDGAPDLIVTNVNAQTVLIVPSDP